VVRHQTVSHNPYPRECFLIAKDFAKNFFFPFSENPPPIHHSGNDVIKASAFSGYSFVR